MGKVADPIPAGDFLRHALHLKAAADELKILGARLEQPGREPASLVSDLGRRAGEGVAAEARAAAAERADRLRRAQGVAVADDHVLPGDTELVGDDLCERRLVALAVRARPGDRRDLAAALDTDDAALPAEHVRRFHVGRDADAHDLAATARCGLLATELVVSGELDDPVEGARVVAGVVRGTERSPVGERAGRDEVAPADLDGIETRRPRGLVHHALDQIDPDRPPRPPIRPGW